MGLKFLELLPQQQTNNWKLYTQVKIEMLISLSVKNSILGNTIRPPYALSHRGKKPHHDKKLSDRHGGGSKKIKINKNSGQRIRNSSSAGGEEGNNVIHSRVEWKTGLVSREWNTFTLLRKTTTSPFSTCNTNRSTLGQGRTHTNTGNSYISRRICAEKKDYIRLKSTLKMRETVDSFFERIIGRITRALGSK